jgi:SNF2 family DNA or RNA helicase
VNDLYVHYFISLGTIEEKIDKLLSKKRAVSGGILGEVEDNTIFSHKEILEIFTRK